MSEELAVETHGLILDGPEGRVYGPLDLKLPARGLNILRAPSGGGNTALALTLAGRMRPSKGSLTVLAETNMYKIRKRVAVAGTKEIDPLDRDVRLHTTIGEYRNWNRHWWQPIARATQDYYEGLLRPVYGTRPLPELGAYISSLSDLDRLLVRIAMMVARPKKEMLIVDDIEQVRARDDRAELIKILENISTRMPVIAHAINPTGLPLEVSL
ncbi:MAG: hypothetical protein Q3962_06575 [Corynebacterium sp.]|nr:hypothetical protein [Corynebacterium sp.]